MIHGEGQVCNRQPQVAEQLSNMEKAACILRERAEALMVKLQPVLRESTTGGEGKGSVEENLCQVAGTIRTHKNHLFGTIDLLSDILDRLEV